MTADQLRRVLDYEGELCLDEQNHRDGKWCPLAVGLGLDRIWGPERGPSHESVYVVLTTLGYRIGQTRGVAGEFYTTDRAGDLRRAVKEVLEEYEQAATYTGEEPYTVRRRLFR